MLELRSYKKAELSEILKTNSRQGMLRKLERWGVRYTTEGRGENLTIIITEMANPFKVYCITELDFDAGTDFQKVRNLYYYFFNDEEFMSMPDEVKEHRMRANEKPVSRQAIHGYIAKLDAKELIDRNTKEYIYYFAYKDTQRITDHDEYVSAWHDYWSDIDNGCKSYEAIMHMRSNYGGVARKQPIPRINGIYRAEIKYLCELIQENIETEIRAYEQF